MFGMPQALLLFLVGVVFMFAIGVQTKLLMGRNHLMIVLVWVSLTGALWAWTAVQFVITPAVIPWYAVGSGVGGTVSAWLNRRSA